MTRLLTRTPRADGYWMPGEFERHAGAWMIWPERLDNWRDGARPAQRAFAAVAAAIGQFEPVSVAASAAQYEFARAQLPPTVRVIEISNNDAWVRDTGPTFVVNAAGRRRAVDWQFNAWGGLDGGLYFPWDQDDLVALRTARGVHRLVPGLTGWAQVNGRDELPIPVKVEMDAEYLSRRSLAFDLRILWMTFLKVLRSDGVTH